MKLKMKKSIKKEKKTNKSRNMIAYILCNKQLKEFRINATRKFNVNDETYVIKSDCCYFKRVDGILEMISFYVEGNPNPFKLEDYNNNIGLTDVELDRYIGGDMFNILIECQEQDKRKYVINLVVVCFVLTLIQFLAILFW